MNYVGGYCVVLDLTGGNLGAWGRCNNVKQRGTGGLQFRKGKSLGQPWLVLSYSFLVLLETGGNLPIAKLFEG